MDLFDVAKSCIRRWYVFVPLFAAAVLFSYHSYTSVKAVYFATTSIGLAPPSVTRAPEGGEIRTNGLLVAGGPNLLSNLLALGLADPTIREQVVAQGGEGAYVSKVFSIPGAQLPIVTIESTSPDLDQVTRTLQIVGAQAATSLRNLQQSARVPDEQMMITYDVAAPSAPVPVNPSRLRGAVTILAAGVGITMIVTVLIDVFLSRRKDKRNRPAPTRTPDSTPNRSGGNGQVNYPSGTPDQDNAYQ